MAIEKIDKDLDVVDSILTKLGKMLKKHWWIIILGLITWFLYWALTTEFEEEYYEDYYEENYNPTL
jgi:protein-S-isoprenylcysteine O-methyltransferase Ste14